MTTALDRAQSGAGRASGRRDGLRIAIAVLGVIGLAIAGYTTYEHYNGFATLLCLGAQHGHSSCQQVQSSRWSELAGIPVSVLGLVGYFVLLVSLAFRGDMVRALAFLVALIGFGFSAYLTYREVFTLKEICEWCVGSAICMTILMVLTGLRFMRGEPEPA
ncbi:MAG TPA: vitamin K epoxide reductase family protein [Solirubrobacteraceae bacterium]|nr:vitamin K epoxide reductase family protein [Solirubrobacteraceae bacterium]